MNELFEGKQKQCVTCGTCGGTSETVETFSCLELNVLAGDEVAAAVSMPDPDPDPDQTRTRTWTRAQTLALALTRAAVLGTLSLASAPHQVGDEPPDVVSALRERQREEELSGDAQYFCERCDCKLDHNPKPNPNPNPNPNPHPNLNPNPDPSPNQVRLQA